jgi:hypothetical protein
MIMPASRSPQQTGDGIAAISLPGIVASRHMMALKRSIESEAKEICGSGMAGSRYRRYASVGHAPDYQRQPSELKDGHSLLPSSLPKVFLLLPGKQTPSDAIALVKLCLLDVLSTCRAAFQMQCRQGCPNLRRRAHPFDRRLDVRSRARRAAAGRDHGRRIRLPGTAPKSTSCCISTRTRSERNDCPEILRMRAGLLS